MWAGRSGRARSQEQTSPQELEGWLRKGGIVTYARLGLAGRELHHLVEADICHPDITLTVYVLLRTNI